MSTGEVEVKIKADASAARRELLGVERALARLADSKVLDEISQRTQELNEAVEGARKLAVELSADG